MTSTADTTQEKTTASVQPPPQTTAKRARATPKATPTTAPKTVTTSKPAPKADVAVAKTSKKKPKTEKVKVVRDSFTIPKEEYARIAELKQRAMALGQAVKKSELIRAGLALLGASSDTAFRKALGNVPTLKTGRPGKA